MEIKSVSKAGVLLTVFMTASIATAKSSDPVQSCKDDLFCHSELQVNKERYYKNPARFNILRSLRDSPIQRTQDIAEGYRHYRDPYRADPSLGDFTSIVEGFISKAPLKALGLVGLNKILNNQEPKEGETKPVYTNPRNFVNPSFDSNFAYKKEIQDYQRKYKEIEKHPENGRTHDEFRKYFPTDKGRLEADSIGVFEIHLKNYLYSRQNNLPDVEEKKKILMDTYGIKEEKIDQYDQKANQLLNHVDPSSDLTRHSNREFINLRNKFSPQIDELKKASEELEKYKKQDGTSQEKIQEIEDDIQEKQKELSDLIKEDAEQDMKETASKAIEPQDNETKKPSSDLKNLEPVYINGRELLGSNKYEYKAKSATAELTAEFLTLAGNAEGAQNFLRVANASLLAMDGYDYIKKTGFGSGSAQDITKAMSSLTNIVGAINLAVEIFGKKKKDPMQEMMENLFAAIDTLLKNQEEMIGNQTLMLYEINIIKQGIQALQNKDFQQARLITEGFAKNQNAAATYYLDLRKSIDRVSDSVKYKNLDRAIREFQSLEVVTGSKPQKVPSNIIENLKKEVPHLIDIIEETVNSPPQLTAEAIDEKFGEPKTQGEKGLATRIDSKASINDLRGYYDKIFTKICSEDNKCHILENVPDASRLYSLTLLYLNAAKILSQTEEGKAFLKRDLNYTFKSLQDKMVALQNASSYARKIAPNAEKAYYDSLGNVAHLFYNYSDSALDVMGGFHGYSCFNSDNSSAKEEQCRPKFTRNLKAKDNLFTLSQLELKTILLDLRTGFYFNDTMLEWWDKLSDEERLKIKLQANSESFDFNIEKPEWWGKLSDEEKLKINAQAKKLPYIFGFSTSSRVAAHLGLGIPLENETNNNAIFTVHHQTPNPGNKLNWRLIHAFGISHALIMDRDRIQSLVGKDNPNLLFLNKNETFRNILGGMSITSRKMQFHIAIQNGIGAMDFSKEPKCTPYLPIHVGSQSACIADVEEDWAFEWRRERPQTQQDRDWLKASIHPGGILGRRVVSAAYNFHGNYYKKIMNAMNELRLEAIGKETENIRSAMVDQWKRVAIGYEPDFTGTTIGDHAGVQDTLNNLRSTLENVKHARIMYDVSLRLGYGDECLHNGTNIRSKFAHLSSGFYPTSHDFKQGHETDGLRPSSEKIKALGRLLKGVEMENIVTTFPKEELLKEQCSLGFAGVETMASFLESYKEWVQNGTTSYVPQ
jgi:hypothetical protein